MSRLLPIATILLLLVTGACRSSRNASGIAGRLTPSTSADLSADTTHHGGSYDLQWADLSLPVTVSVTKPTSLRIGGTMTMVNGRDILISLRMFGFEVGAAYITADSVYAYAKMQRVYVAESITDILGGLNADVSTVQSLLIGSPLTLPHNANGTEIDITTLPTTGQPLTISISHSSGRAASIAYTPVEGAPLAEETAISAVSARSELAASLSYDWSRAQVDKGNTRSFSIPNGYRRLSGAALLKSLAAK